MVPGTVAQRIERGFCQAVVREAIALLLKVAGSNPAGTTSSKQVGDSSIANDAANIAHRPPPA